MSRLAVTSVDNFAWSERATVPESQAFHPPLPGSPEFASGVRGRAGEMIVVQLKGNPGLRATQLASLRSLGLKGPGSSSLRMADATTWGMIDSVRNYVGVVLLNGVFCKEEQDKQLQFERIQYGNSTRPAALVRAVSGEYFAYESDRNSVHLMWGSNASLTETLETVATIYEDLQPVGTSVFGIVKETDDQDLQGRQPGGSASQLDYASQPDLRVTQGPTLELLEALPAVLDRTRFARVAFRGLDVTWQDVHAPFDDMPDFACQETALIARFMDFGLAKRFVMATALNPDLLKVAQLQVEVLHKGTRKVYNL